MPGDLLPDGLINPTGTFTVTVPELNLAGTATDDKGVQSVELTVFDNDTGRYMQDNGQMLSGYNRVNATLAAPGATSTAWTLPIVLPTGGDYSITAFAFDTSGQQDPSTTGATARYRYYPGDLPPAFEAALGQPVDGSTFTEGKIVVSGRAIDDISIARVEVGIVNSAGQYMSSTGTFTSTTPSWRQAFLNSPGSPGSNFSYTTPVIPDGTYSVLVRPTDHHDQIGETRTSVGIVVTHPVNNPPVASATVSCAQNVCSFDGRGSTDENPTALVYSWNFGTNQGTGSGPIPIKTYTAPGTYSVVLTVRDEWNVTSTAALSVTITEPAGNVAPVPTFLTSCHRAGLLHEQHGNGRPERRGHDRICVELGRRHGDRHRHRTGSHLRNSGHVHDHFDHHRRMGQGSQHDPTGRADRTSCQPAADGDLHRQLHAQGVPDEQLRHERPQR